MRLRRPTPPAAALALAVLAAAATAPALHAQTGEAGTAASASASASAPAPATATPSAPADTARWDFAVFLDGKPIGSHRFTVTGPAAARSVDSQAQFDVKLLGLTVYRYRHQAQERWQGD